MGFNYLDSKGIEFYLPAFMTLAIDQPSYSTLSLLAFELDPTVGESDDLYQHFRQKYSRITGRKKTVTVEFLGYLLQASKTLPLIGGVLEQIDTDEIAQIAAHEFWKDEV